MTNDEVIRVLKNFLDCMPKTYRRRNDNASVVQDIILFRTRTAGRTSCKELCREIGIDPCGHTLEPFKEGEASGKNTQKNRQKPTGNRRSYSCSQKQSDNRWGILRATF